MLEHVAEEVDKIGNHVVDRQIEHIVDKRACHREQAADHADGARRFVLRPVRVVDVRGDNADQNDDRVIGIFDALFIITTSLNHLKHSDNPIDWCTNIMAHTCQETHLNLISLCFIF